MWTVPQTAAFLDAIDSHRMYAAFHLMALRGLRRGETAGLRWMDIDLDNGVLYVHVQNQRRDGELVMCPPETTASIAAHFLSDLFRRLIKTSGLPPVRLHDLRHGAASLALQAGADLKVVSDQLGHSSIVLTADTYISVLPDLARDVAQKVAELILRHGSAVPGTRRTRRAEPACAIIRIPATARAA